MENVRYIVLTDSYHYYHCVNEKELNEIIEVLEDFYIKYKIFQEKL